MQTAPLTASLTSDGVAALRLSVEWVQAARHGSIELDVLIAEVLRCASTSDLGDAARASDRIVGGARWSTDLDAALTLLPHDYNFSTGCRDGVYWAWIQPNDAWAPAEHEARHDHPGGSGLVTAHTAALAMICAAILLRIHRVMGADDVAEL